jgi:hypothetical protein
VVASPAYLARMGTPSAPSDLLDHTAIVYTQGLVAEEWRFRRATADTSVRIPTRLSFSAADAYARDGMRAITLISKSNPASQFTPMAVQLG